MEWESEGSPGEFYFWLLEKVEKNYLKGLGSLALLVMAVVR